MDIKTNYKATVALESSKVPDSLQWSFAGYIDGEWMNGLAGHTDVQGNPGCYHLSEVKINWNWQDWERVEPEIEDDSDCKDPGKLDLPKSST